MAPNRFRPRNLKAAHPKRDSFDRVTVLAAMEAIQDRNATALAMAGLLVEDWSGKRIDQIESTMFQGTFVKTPKDPAPVSDGFGRSIPGPDKQPAAKAVKISTKPNRNTTVTYEEYMMNTQTHNDQILTRLRKLHVKSPRDDAFAEHLNRLLKRSPSGDLHAARRRFGLCIEYSVMAKA